MKNRKLLLIVSIMLATLMSLGGTLAYLNDTDSDVNTMTLGNVKIEQHEFERVVENGEYKKGTVDNQESYLLQEFTQNKPLLPIVGNPYGGYDPIPTRLSQLGHNSRGGADMLNVKNAQDKFVVVENTGNTPAYVRTLIAFEAGSVAEEDWNNLVNYSSHFTWKETQDWFIAEINGNNYYMVEFVYDGYQDVQHPKGKLTAGDYTYPSLTQVYVYSHATNEDLVKLDGNKNGTFDILVLSQAIQAEGFADATTALTEGFGAFTPDNVKSWFEQVPVAEDEVDTSWYSENKTEFVLTTVEELHGLAKLVNGGNSFAGKTVKLGADINLAGQEWKPIGNSETTAFEGNFDGQGHTISNLYIESSDGVENALFGCIANSEITGITVKNVDITGYSESAAIVGYAEGSTISDCHVRGKVNIVSEWAYVGGIAAHGYMDIENCSVIADGTGVIKSETRNAVGGIAAWMWEGNNRITGCRVENLEITGWTNVGCISGFIAYNNVFDGNAAKNIVLTKTREGGNPGIGLAAGGYGYNSEAPSTITNNTFTNVELNAESLEFAAYNMMYGSEYYGKENANFVMNGNTASNITDNTTIFNP